MTREEQNLVEARAEHKRLKRLRNIWKGNLTKRNRPVIIGWNRTRPAAECRVNY